MNRRYVWMIVSAVIVLVAALLFKNFYSGKDPDRIALTEADKKHAAEPAHKQDDSELEPTDASSEIGGKWYGLCDKNKIHSVDDFKKLVNNDPVLARHFSGFDWKNAKMDKLEEAMFTYVSYRKGEKIKQTRKPVRLPKGDRYITDGSRYVRAYCCNDYVIAPPPVSSIEDSPKEIVAGPPLQLSAGAPFKDMEAPPPLQGMTGPPGQKSSGSPVPGFGLPTNQLPYLTPFEVSPVPIPGSLLLFGSGTAMLGMVRVFLRRRK